MKKYFLIFAVALSSLSVWSCKSDSTDEPNTFEGIYYDERTSDREYLEHVATEVLGLIKPADQQKAITALHGFCVLCETCTFPENFYDEDTNSQLRAVIKDLESNDYQNASRAIASYVYNMARFKGLYQASPGSDAWVKIEDRDNVTFKYWIGSNEYNLTVTGTGDAWSNTITSNDISYTVEVPKKLDLMLIQGSTSSTNSVISVELTTDFKDGNNLRAVSSTRFANIQIESTLKSSSTRMTEDMTIYHNNPSTYYRKTMVSTSAELNGSNLCSSAAWIRAAKSNDAESLASMFTDASMTMMVYGSLQIKASVTDMRRLLQNSDLSWSSAEYPDAKAKADKCAETLSSCLKAQTYYYSDNMSKVRGSIGWQSYIADETYGDEVWSVRPVLTLASDGATYDFASYFGNGRFLSVENTINSIIKAYTSYWK